MDVYNYVMLLRSQRNLMVQVEDQYILIHDVLVEAIACGNTEIQARDLRREIKNLMQQNVETGKKESYGILSAVLAERDGPRRL